MRSNCRPASFILRIKSVRAELWRCVATRGGFPSHLLKASPASCCARTPFGFGAEPIWAAFPRRPQTGGRFAKGQISAKSLQSTVEIGCGADSNVTHDAVNSETLPRWQTFPPLLRLLRKERPDLPYFTLPFLTFSYRLSFFFLPSCFLFFSLCLSFFLSFSLACLLASSLSFTLSFSVSFLPFL